VYLSLDRDLVGGDEVVRSSSFPTCRHDDGHGCRSAVLRGDHHCDVVWWSTWLELGGAARDVVDVVWSMWSKLGGAARDVVDVVWSISSVVGAQQRAESWHSWTKSRARVEVVGVNPVGVEVKKRQSRTVFLGRSAWPRRPLVERLG